MSFKIKDLKLTYKIMPLILAGTLIALVAGFSLLLNQFSTISKNQIALSHELLTTEQALTKAEQLKALESKALTLGSFMSSVAIDLILSSDYEALILYKNNAEKDPDISYAGFIDAELKPYVALNKPTTDVDSAQVFEKKYKIESDGDMLGYVLLGVSKKSVNASIVASDNRILVAVKKVENNADRVYNAFLIILAFIVLGITIVVVGSVYFSFKKLIISRLKDTTALMNELSQGNGDLTKRLPAPNNDEISQLCETVNKFVIKLQRMILQISGDVNQLTQEALSLEGQGKSLSADAAAQSDDASLAASAMVEMTGSVEEVFHHTESAEAMALKADGEAQEGKKIVNETIGAITLLSNEISETATVINSLQSDSEKIGGVLDVIRGIAEQTNLLALNAAIEAARAGDQGRGFAVVADEVRTLASRTQTATEEINEMIDNLQQGSKNAVAAMSRNTETAAATAKQALLADTSLKNIAEAVKAISDMNTQIATASQEQKRVADSVGQSVERINTTSQKTADSAHNTAEVGKALSSLSHDLKEMVGQFKA